MQIHAPESNSTLFKVADFESGAQQFYILDVTEETFDFNSGPETAYVVSFHNEEKRLKLGKKNLTALVDMFGTDSDNWKNQLVTLQKERLAQPFNGANYRLAVVYQQPLAAAAPSPAPAQPAAPPPPPPAAPATAAAVPPPPPPPPAS